MLQVQNVGNDTYKSTLNNVNLKKIKTLESLQATRERASGRIQTFRAYETPNIKKIKTLG